MKRPHSRKARSSRSTAAGSASARSAYISKRLSIADRRSSERAEVGGVVEPARAAFAEGGHLLGVGVPPLIEDQVLADLVPDHVVLEGPHDGDPDVLAQLRRRGPARHERRSRPGHHGHARRLDDPQIGGDVGHADLDRVDQVDHRAPSRSRPRDPGYGSAVAETPGGDTAGAPPTMPWDMG